MTEEAQQLPKPIDPIEAKIEVGVKRRPQKLAKAGNRGSLKVVGLILVSMLTSGVTVWFLATTNFFKLPNPAQTTTNTIAPLPQQNQEIVASVFKLVNPSAVAITTQATTNNRFYGAAVEEGAGSGIIISKDGYVITNKHVIPSGVSQVTVVLADGREFSKVAVVGTDPFMDIAFLKIQGASNLTPAALGDSSLVEPGQGVVAIGNALGQFRNSVTAGVISGLGRPVQASDGTGGAENLEDMFQTDAAINPGNSGGPLLNLRGEVIGINTAVAAQAQGIGFAIPINNTKGIINSVLKQGKIVKPYLGVRYITLTSELATQLRLIIKSGAYVAGSDGQPAVVPESPADKAGIHEHDIITKVNGKELKETLTLSSVLAQFTVGDKVNLTITRGGKEQTVTATLEAYPNS